MDIAGAYFDKFLLHLRKLDDKTSGFPTEICLLNGCLLA